MPAESLSPSVHHRRRNHRAPARLTRASPVKRIIEDIGPVLRRADDEPLLAAPKESAGGREPILFRLASFRSLRPLRPLCLQHLLLLLLLLLPLAFLPLATSLPSLTRGPTFRECPFRVCTQKSGSTVRSSTIDRRCVFLRCPSSTA